MCAQFMVRTRRKDLARQLGLPYTGDEAAVFDLRILPYQQAPVVLEDATGKRQLRMMQFSLLPAWSKERRAKFATHNARLWSVDDKTGRNVPVYEKPTWRGPFAHRHCLVPLTDFIEPIYTGEYAGNMVRFLPKGGKLLAAAAIWEEWTDRQTGEIVDSFSILTDDPLPFVAQIGHDRSPIFLAEEAYEKWLKPEGLTPAESVKLLREYPARPELEVEIDRPLKAGWEKRRSG